MNATLYLPRSLGGTGLRNLEMTYKKTKIKAAMNLLNSTDPRMKVVRAFHEQRMKEGKCSLIKDAIKFAKEDFDLHLTLSESGFEVEFENKGDVMDHLKIVPIN